jgi:hypothetical protein
MPRQHTAALSYSPLPQFPCHMSKTYKKMQYETCRESANTYLRVHVPQAQAVPVHWVAQHFFGDPRGFLASSARRRPPGLVRDSLEWNPCQSLPPKRVLLT